MGIDIDWEFPKTSQDRANYTALLSELRVALDDASANIKPGFKFGQGNFINRPKGGKFHLSVAIAPNAAGLSQYLDLSAIDRYTDFVIYMAYDYHGGWSRQTGHQAAIYNSAINGETDVNFNLDSSTRIYTLGEVSAGINPNGYNSTGINSNKFYIRIAILC